MPDIYISRAGMESKALDEKFIQTELGTLKDDLAKVKQALRIEKERTRHLEESMFVMQSNFDTFSEALRLNPAMKAVEAVVRNKAKLK